MKLRFLWRTFKARLRDEVAELRAIRQAVRPDDVVCDIGANKGSYLLWLSRWVPQGSVIAFEPQPDLASNLRATCESMGLKNVIVEAKAVHARPGTVSLHIPGAGDSPSASIVTRSPVEANATGRCVQVPVVTLDEYFSPEVRIGAMKIDVEGAERGVFEGAARVLDQWSPLLVFECENRHLATGTVMDVFHDLMKLGYSGQFVAGRMLRPLVEFDPLVHQRRIGDRYWDARDYVNNFVFRKPAQPAP